MTYFVNARGGSDMNSGTSYSCPFQHFPGSLDAIGRAAVVQLRGGDTVQILGSEQNEGV
jgi:hypothetical protein